MWDLRRGGRDETRRIPRCEIGSTQKPEISKRCQAVSGGVGVSRVKFKDEGGAGEPASANRGRALDLQTKCFPWLRKISLRSL